MVRHILKYVAVASLTVEASANPWMEGPHVTIGGSVMMPGPVSLPKPEPIATFLIRNGYIRANDQMKAAWHTTESLPHYVVRVVRNNELKEFAFRGGQGFLNTIYLQDGDVIEVRLTNDLDVVGWRRLDGILRLDDKLQPNQVTKSEQAGTGQPATRSESKSDGNENPNHEAEGRSR